MAILDSRDTEICLWQDSGVVCSPGVVLLQGGEYSFGQDALAEARARPRDSSNRFWWQLGTQPLQPALGAARHTADLVHSHLRAIHQEAGSPAQLAMAIPDSMPREQLSLLLGVAKACDFTVSGLASRSVLLASGCEAARSQSRVLHLEVQLHQAVLNELQIEDGWVTLLRSTPLPACGLLALQERCVSAIASAFIQQTRFDPRRSAQSEQSLYNALPGILDTLAERGEASVDIDGHRSRVTATALAGVMERLSAGLAPIIDSEQLPLLLDPELHRLPGLQELPGEHHPLHRDALWQAFLAHREQIESDTEGLHLIDRLPLHGGAALAEPPKVAAQAASAPLPPTRRGTGSGASHAADRIHGAATHVLIGVRALPLRGEAVDLGSGYQLRIDGDHWTLHGDGALINGLPSAPQQPLALGDTLFLGSAGHGRLIEVQD
ncbi:MAG: hypothetical protein ACI87W_002813 [Halieaceae bacterium]|jgi:hypothetical protein